jgi:hypothetical protein
MRYLDLLTSYGMSTEVRTKSGFPVRVWVNVYPADWSVGLGEDVDYTITTLNNCDVSWLNLDGDEKEELVIKARKQLDVDEDFCEPDGYYD